ncbi:TPA: DUF551 domain-containing protein [Escherichia coli]|nr:DUF551 domain-containing protein [Escherichia coli]HAV7717207.1 DUF551 domain-containing protein [Escherichia coli]HAV9553300.1 DUF551 domain-containing protein [Escherichia coli]HAW5409155.1 DUF551 domain-containing protein [Escherichia coli]HAW6368649.1 DUF551 domain-containing protein [Escherichia coli]
MTTITKERIELFIKNPLENGLTRGEQMELARIALASLEAEPIGAFHIAEQQVDGTSDYLKDGEWPVDNGIIEVYAAPPVPVVPEEMYWQDAPVEGSSKAAAYATGWNACRAAMLHSAEPVSQAYKLNALDGNSPVTPDGWISCSERMPAQDDWILIYSKHGEYMAGQVQGEYVELSDGTLSWLGNALFWTPLPEPPQEVNRG